MPLGTTVITITGLFHLPDFCVVILKLNLPKLLYGVHYKCLSQLVGVAAHLKHSAQPPNMGQSFIMNDPVEFKTSTGHKILYVPRVMALD
jgi:hypothetical protein